MKIIDANGAKIPAIGLGTYTLEGAICVDMVAEAIDAGYRHIDTARMYGNEAEVGKGIAKSGVDRGELFVTTKIWWTDIGRDDFARATDAALAALDVGPVDLLLIHWPNAEIALEESIDALNAARSAGLTKHIGVANFTSAMVDEAAAMSSAPLACNQVEYHPFLSQENIHQACLRNGMAMIAYCPIGKGGDLLSNDLIGDIAKSHGKSPAQVVLRWEVEQDKVGAIPRTSRPERLPENIDIFDFELTADEHEAIGKLTHRRERLIDPSFAPNWDRA